MLIEKEIKRSLSRQMLFGDLKNGGKVQITIKDNAVELVCDNKEDNIRKIIEKKGAPIPHCLLYTTPTPRDRQKSRMPGDA